MLKDMALDSLYIAEVLSLSTIITMLSYLCVFAVIIMISYKTQGHIHVLNKHQIFWLTP